MKKLLAAILALMLLLSAAALAEAVDPGETVQPVETEDVAGVWYMSEMTREDGAVVRPWTLGMVFTLELLDDGAAVITDARGDYRQVDKGVWQQEGTMVSIVVDDDFSILLRLQGDALVTEDAQSRSKWVFGREEPPQAYQPAAAVDPTKTQDPTNTQEPANTAEPEDAGDIEAPEAAERTFDGDWKVVKVQVASLYYDPEVLGEDPGATISGTTLTLTGGMPFGATPVELRPTEDGALVHEGLEVEPTPFVEITPEPTPVPPVEMVNEDGETILVTAEPTPEPTPTPTPEPTIEPRLRTSRFDITVQMLEDDTLSMTFGVDGETLAVFILERA